jgi:predicted nucleotidyltransferase
MVAWEKASQQKAETSMAATSQLDRNIVVCAEALEQLCLKWKVRELSLFGSVLREDFGPDSDIDVLISFQEEAPWSLWDLIAMRDEMAEMFGRPVDLVEREALRNPFRRKRILESHRTIYRHAHG